MENVHIREDFRRDGLCMNFLVDKELMVDVARSFPGAILNIGYPAICSKEKEICKEIIGELSNEEIETAVVGHALPSHLKTMALLANTAENTSANFWVPFSDYMIGQTMKKTPEEVLSHAREMAKIWANLSDRPIDVALVDSASGESNSVNRLQEFYSGLKGAGVRSVIVCDTKGQTTTQKLTDLLVGFKGTNADLEYHPHNDNGLVYRNIETAISLGVKGIGTGIFGHGERGTMVDPRELVARYGIAYNPEAFSNFEKGYNKIIRELDEENKIFSSNTVVTGTQYRLRGRDSKLNAKFGVTSDKYILGGKLGIKPSEISNKVLESIKNDLYIERKRTFSAGELKTKYSQYNGR